MADEAPAPAPDAAAPADQPATPAADPQPTESALEGLDKLADAASKDADERNKEADEPANPANPADPEKPAEGEPENQPAAGDEGDEPKGGKPDPQAAKQSFQERSRLRGEVASTLDSIGKPQTTEDLVAQGVDPALAEVEALKQDIQRKEVINYVADLNSSLNVDANNLVRDFPVFDPESSEYDEKFSTKVENLYKARGFKTDPSGKFVIEAGPLYEFYAAFAEARGTGAKAGVVSGQKAAEKMLAAADTPSSAAPAASGNSGDENPFLKGLKGGATK